MTFSPSQKLKPIQIIEPPPAPPRYETGLAHRPTPLSLVLAKILAQEARR